MADIRKFDFIIAGQGLAGSLLSYFLLKKGKTCLVVDPCLQDTSSSVAAGMMHAITGRRLLKSWKADTFIPFAKSVYKELETILGAAFIKDLTVFEVYNDPGHRNDWMGRMADPSYAAYISDELIPAAVPAFVDAPCGILQLVNSSRLDTETFLTTYRKHLKLNNAFLNDEINFEEVEIKENTVHWKNIEAKKIINCKGYIAKFDRYFSYLPFLPAKGELLTIYCKEIPAHIAIHHIVKIIPEKENHFICGSTFSWDQLDNVPTTAAYNKLKEGIKKSLRVPFEITGHRAGVRPATQDRRPFLGLQPKHPQLGIFNGFGSKGVMMGPWLANRMADYLCGRTVLEPEYDIGRIQN